MKKKTGYDYLNDLRWKRVTEFCQQMKFNKASILANEIIDSYDESVKIEARRIVREESTSETL